MRIGCDIIENERMDKVLGNSRVFSAEEIEYCDSFEPTQRRSHYAGFWATKEAVRKALNCEVGMKDICITHTDSGEPKIIINDIIKNALKKYKLNNINISISNEKNYSIAYCLID